VSLDELFVIPENRKQINKSKITGNVNLQLLRHRVFTGQMVFVSGASRPPHVIKGGKFLRIEYNEKRWQIIALTQLI